MRTSVLRWVLVRIARLPISRRPHVFLVFAVSCCIWKAARLTIKHPEARRQEILSRYDRQESASSGSSKGTTVASFSLPQKLQKPEVNQEVKTREDRALNLMPSNCADGKDENWAYVDPDGRFVVSERAQKLHGNISCSIMYLVRVNDNRLLTRGRIAINSGDLVDKEDFSEVSCTAADQKCWSGLLVTVAPKDYRVRRAMNALRERESQGSTLDVFLIGFSAQSQSSFRQNFPSTVNFIEKELEGVILDGYNAVGDDSMYAFIPILTGRSENELPLARRGFKKASYVDDVYPLIWNNFSDLGYVTLYADDSNEAGSFSYLLKGFRNQPTDHYARTFLTRAKSLYVNICNIGSEPLYKKYFRYAYSFMTKYNITFPKFLVVFHSLLEPGDVTKMRLADNDTVELLQKLKGNSALEFTVVIVMSDSGTRFSKVRETDPGPREKHLPFFSIALPKLFRRTQLGEVAFKNLKENKHRLTSPFDIYSTLLDILKWPDEETLSKMGDSKKRSLSLFRPIPTSRTCREAGISEHWCASLQWQSSMRDRKQHSESLAIANAVVQVMNRYTRKERNLCASLDLERLEDVKRAVVNESLMQYGHLKRGKAKRSFISYQLSFWTKPGNAHYEVTVGFNTTAVRVDFTAFSVLNKKDDISHCIMNTDTFLAPFCVCYDRIN